MADFQSHGCECATIVKQRVGKIREDVIRGSWLDGEC